MGSGISLLKTRLITIMERIERLSVETRAYHESDVDILIVRLSLILRNLLERVVSDLEAPRCLSQLSTFSPM